MNFEMPGCQECNRSRDIGKLTVNHFRHFVEFLWANIRTVCEAKVDL